MISGSVLLYGHISMGGHNNPEVENLNMLLQMLLQGLYEPYTHFCPLCMLRLFQSLGKNGNLIITVENSCLVL
jgi:hypothetical protein